MRVRVLSLSLALFLAAAAGAPFAPAHVRATQEPTRCERWFNAGTVPDDAKDAAFGAVWRGYQILLDCYVDSPDGRRLLNAAYGAAASAAAQPGQYLDEPDVDLATLESHFEAAMRRLMDDAPAEIPPILLAQAAIDGMAESIADNHTAFRPLDSQTDLRAPVLRQRPDLGLSSIGIVGGALIWEVQADGPAARAQIAVGDVIVSVQEAQPGQGIATRIGVPLILGIHKTGVGVIQVQITPRADEPSLDSSLSPEGIAQLRLRSFRMGSPLFNERYASQLDDLEQRCPKGWILDLRNNPGGRLDLAETIAGKFGYSGSLLVARRRYPSTPVAETAPVRSIRHDQPLVILVNGRSASASEVVAAALQDAGLAYVIGTRTSGAVNLSWAFVVARGELSVTIARALVGPFQRNVDRTGVMPNEIVEMDRRSLIEGRDPQIERAKRYIDESANGSSGC